MSSGKPLQIIDLRQTAEGKSEVVICEPALKELEQILKATNADCVSLLSVMGAYRTGKSFVLDLLMRRLRVLEKKFQEQASSAGATEATDTVKSKALSRKSFHIENLEATGDRMKAENFKLGSEEGTNELPEWVRDGNATHLTDGKDDNKDKGFEWKGGKDKCTQGIWVYSRPFLFKKGGRTVALLVVDTQGAWDGQMSKHQSATIFGLTALISTNLIYNIQNRIDEDKIDNLDYFVTFANAAMSSLGDSGKLGDLIFLVRDWQNYEDEWSLNECEKDMQEHLNSHLGEGTPEDSREKVQRITESFENVWCHGLVHPGKKIPKNNWTGEISDIDPDFFFLLDHFTHRMFSGVEFPKPAAPLNVELKPKNFAEIIRNFIKAFDETKDFAMGLRDAFVTVQVMSAREEMAKKFKQRVRQEISDALVYDPQYLKDKMDIIAKEIETEFMDVKLKALSLKPHEKEAELEKLRSEGMALIMNTRLKNNDLVLKNANIKLAASPAVGLSGMVVLTHHAIGYVAAPGYVVWRQVANAKSHNKSVLSGEVFAATGEDCGNFVKERFKDMQAMKIAISNMRSEEIHASVNEHLESGKNLAKVASAAGAASAASSSTTP